MKGGHLITGLAVLFVIAVLVMSAGIGPLARRVPVAVALPTLALLLCQLYLDRKAGSGPRKAAEIPGEAPSRSRERTLAAVILLFAICIYLFGFAIAIPLFVFVYAKKLEGQRSLPAAGIAMATGIVLTVVFGVLLDVRLFGGQVSVWMKWMPW